MVPKSNIVCSAPIYCPFANVKKASGRLFAPKVRTSAPGLGRKNRIKRMKNEVDINAD